MNTPQNPLPVEKSIYGGFWRRAVAFLIDYNLVMLISALLIMLMAVCGFKDVVVESPFGIGRTESIIESKKETKKLNDGSLSTVEETYKEITEFGHWKYIYKEEVTTVGEKDDTSFFIVSKDTKEKISPTSSDDISLYLLLIYMVLMEISPIQGSIGKKLLVGEEIVSDLKL